MWARGAADRSVHVQVGLGGGHSGGHLAVDAERAVLARQWRTAPATPPADLVARVLGADADALDRLDRVQLGEVLAVSRRAVALRCRPRIVCGVAGAPFAGLKLVAQAMHMVSLVEAQTTRWIGS